MLWPVLLHDSPDTAWSVGERVSTRLRWLDDPQLPDELVRHRVVLHAGTRLDHTGEPWMQLLEAGDLRAIREGDHRAGDVTLDGCLGFDHWLAYQGEWPATVGTVRRIRLVQDLHDRGADEWIRRPGETRLTDVPDAGYDRRRDDPALGELTDSSGEEPDPSRMRIFSPEQYFLLPRDRLPEQQWQARGFLVDLEISDGG